MTADNPPAFPTQNHVIHQPGMDLRDYFAAAALQGILASPHRATSMSEEGGPERFAASAYLMADAFLSARTPAPATGDE